MSGFGDALRHARANKGVTLTEAERAIRIPRKYLRALEDEDFTALPEGVYSRGIVRNYAQYLNLDPDDAIAYFDELRGQGSGGFKVVPAVRPLEVPSHWAPNFALIAFMVVISAVLFAWLYSAFFAARETPLPTPSPAVATPTNVNMTAAILSLTPTAVPPTATPAPSPTNQPPTQTQGLPPTVARQPAPVQQAPAQQKPPPSPTPSPADTHTVQVKALDNTNVTVTVDGTVQYQGDLAAGQAVTFTGVSIDIQSDNATAVYLLVDGQDHGPLSEDADSAEITIP
ncbi:MAG: helix-turn-helix domain-containing protein [Thermomicrobiales bacterium]|nr:helix-turn-helix domain-containing protein [Thermomicrobiales bacterium]